MTTALRMVAVACVALGCAGRSQFAITEAYSNGRAFGRVDLAIDRRNAIRARPIGIALETPSRHD